MTATVKRDRPFGVARGENYDPAAFDDDGFDRRNPLLHIGMLRGEERKEAERVWAQRKAHKAEA